MVFLLVAAVVGVLLLAAVAAVVLVRRARRLQTSTDTSFEVALRRLGATPLEDAPNRTSWSFRLGEQTLTAIRVTPSRSPPRHHLVADVEPTEALGEGPFRGSARRVMDRLPVLTMRREQALDRWGKGLRLNRELQLDDDAFDPIVYLDSDADDDLVRATLEEPAARRAVVAMLDGGASAVALAQTEGAVVVTWEGHREDPFAGEALPSVADQLVTLVDALPPVASCEPSNAFPPGGAWLAGGLVAVTAGIILGTVGRHFFPPFGGGLYRSGLLAGLALGAIYFAATFVAVRGTSRAVRMLGWTALCAVGGGPMFGMGAAVAVNGAFDGEPRVVDVQVLSRRESRSDSTSYYVTFAPFGDLTEPAEVSVSSDDYDELHAGPHRVRVGDGALGAPWFSGVVR